VNNILRRGTESGLASAPESHNADDFQTFFQSKVLTVRSATTVHSTAAAAAADRSGEVPVQPATSGNPRCPLLTTWRECSAEEVRRMVMAAPVKSSLDPIPTFLLRECIDVILPYLTAMINTYVIALQLFASLPEDGSCDTVAEEGFSGAT